MPSTRYKGPDASQSRTSVNRGAHSRASHTCSSASAVSRSLRMRSGGNPPGPSRSAVTMTENPKSSARRCTRKSRIRHAAAAAAPASNSPSSPRAASHTPPPDWRPATRRDPRADASAVSQPGKAVRPQARELPVIAQLGDNIYHARHYPRLGRRGKGTGTMEPRESLQMNDKRSRTIRLSVNPRADFRDVIRTLESITLPRVRVSNEHVRFAVLELLNNSIRAHKEKREPRDISIDLTMTDGKLVVTIRDYGGGSTRESSPTASTMIPRGLTCTRRPSSSTRRRTPSSASAWGSTSPRRPSKTFGSSSWTRGTSPWPGQRGRQRERSSPSPSARSPDTSSAEEANGS